MIGAGVIQVIQSKEASRGKGSSPGLCAGKTDSAATFRSYCRKLERSDPHWEVRSACSERSSTEKKVSGVTVEVQLVSSPLMDCPSGQEQRVGSRVKCFSTRRPPRTLSTQRPLE